MKRIYTAVLAALVLGLGSLNAQVFYPQLTPLKEKDMKGDLYPERQGDSWGFVNSKGKFVIKPVFEAAEGFIRVSSEGAVLDVAKIRANGLWGYVSRAGIYFIEPDYEYISNFDFHSTAVARKGSDYTLIGVERDHGDNLRTDVLKAVALENGFGAEFTYTMKGYAVAMKGGRYGIIDTKGRWAVPCEYELIAIDGGFYRIEKDGLMGLVSLDGKLVFPCEYRSIKPLYGDVSLIQGSSGGFGLASQEGKVLLDSVYDSIDIRDSGSLNLHRRGLCGVCDRGGKIIVPVEFNEVETLPDGNFLVLNTDGYNIYTRSGAALFDHGYDSIEPGPRNGYLVCRNGLHGRTDEEGKFIYPCIFESVPDPQMNGYVELYVDDVPHIFLAGDSEAITVEQYDDDNYRKMSERRYRESDALPSWLKGHLPRSSSPRKWLLSKDGEVEVYSSEEYETLLCYYYHEWAGRVEVGICLNGSKEYQRVECDTLAILPLIPVSFDGVSGSTGTVYSTELVIEAPASNGISLYRIMRTPHLWKKTKGVIKETGVEEAQVLSCGYIGLGCDFFVQPLFADARAFSDDGTAQINIDGEWQTLTADELKALDPFLLPE